MATEDLARDAADAHFVRAAVYQALGFFTQQVGCSHEIRLNDYTVEYRTIASTKRQGKSRGSETQIFTVMSNLMILA